MALAERGISLSFMFLMLSCNNLQMHATGFPPTEWKEAGPGADLPVLRPGETPEKPYKILGKVYALDKINWIYSDYTEEMLLEQLRPAVAAVGGDALVGFHSQHDVRYGATAKFQRWGSGLAVKWITLRDSEAPTLPPCGVLVADPIFPSPLQTAKLESKEYPDLFRRSLQASLEEKGYYALLPEEADASKCPMRAEFEMLNIMDAGVVVSTVCRLTLRRQKEEGIVWRNEEKVQTSRGLSMLIIDGPTGLMVTAEKGAMALLESMPDAEGKSEISL